MTAKVELRLCGPMDHLRLVWQTGETLLESVPFQEDPEGTRYNVLLALQEMVTNVLRHAYQGDEKRPVEVQFEAAGDGIAVTLRDQGPEFNPLEVDSPEPRSSMQAIPDGGYGIMIARMVMDTIDYRRERGWNVVRMQKVVRAPVMAGVRTRG